jgi:hypothetical protein
VIRAQERAQRARSCFFPTRRARGAPFPNRMGCAEPAPCRPTLVRLFRGAWAGKAEHLPSGSVACLHPSGSFWIGARRLARASALAALQLRLPPLSSAGLATAADRAPHQRSTEPSGKRLRSWLSCKIARKPGSSMGTDPSSRVGSSHAVGLSASLVAFSTAPFLRSLGSAHSYPFRSRKTPSQSSVPSCSG